MGLFKHNSDTIQEENGELTKYVGELDCEEAIIKDKEEFGRVRNSMMKVLRAKYGYDTANRTLNRVNKRIQKGHLQQN
jgi:viroplasmin and RNaseH domain-containing protein